MATSNALMSGSGTVPTLAKISDSQIEHFRQFSSVVSPDPTTTTTTTSQNIPPHQVPLNAHGSEHDYGNGVSGLIDSQQDQKRRKLTVEFLVHDDDSESLASAPSLASLPSTSITPPSLAQSSAQTTTTASAQIPNIGMSTSNQQPVPTHLPPHPQWQQAHQFSFRAAMGLPQLASNPPADDHPPSNDSVDIMRALISAPANSHAQALSSGGAQSESFGSHTLPTASGPGFIRNNTIVTSANASSNETFQQPHPQQAALILPSLPPMGVATPQQYSTQHVRSHSIPHSLFGTSNLITSPPPPGNAPLRPQQPAFYQPVVAHHLRSRSWTHSRSGGGGNVFDAFDVDQVIPEELIALGEETNVIHQSPIPSPRMSPLPISLDRLTLSGPSTPATSPRPNSTNSTPRSTNSTPRSVTAAIISPRELSNQSQSQHYTPAGVAPLPPVGTLAQLLQQVSPRLKRRRSGTLSMPQPVSEVAMPHQYSPDSMWLQQQQQQQYQSQQQQQQQQQPDTSSDEAGNGDSESDECEMTEDVSGTSNAPPFHRRTGSSGDFDPAELFEESNREKAVPLRQLAFELALTNDPKKNWRFRDFKRSLFERLKQDHATFIETNPDHSLLVQRLPHKMSMAAFARRLLLLVFHFIIRDGRSPRFWLKADQDKVREALGGCTTSTSTSTSSSGASSNAMTSPVVPNEVQASLGLLPSMQSLTNEILFTPNTAAGALLTQQHYMAGGHGSSSMSPPLNNSGGSPQPLGPPRSATFYDLFSPDVASRAHNYLTKSNMDVATAIVAAQGDVYRLMSIVPTTTTTTYTPTQCIAAPMLVPQHQQYRQ